jgi:Protein of unknown function (DUF805)
LRAWSDCINQGDSFGKWRKRKNRISSHLVLYGDSFVASLKMRIRIADLWTWRGTIDRASYIFWGLLLSCLKYAIDRTVARVFFSQDWEWWRYFTPIAIRPIGDLSTHDRFYLALLLIALPFIAVGTALTVRRLRAVGAPDWLVVTFFVPILNLLMFLTLSLVPSKETSVITPKRPRRSTFIPESKLGSAVLAIVLNVSSALIFTRFSVQTLNHYGWGLFVGLPFSIGFTSAMIYSYHGRRTMKQCQGVAFASMGVVFLVILAFAYEGIVCVAMAAPIGLALSALGAALGYAIQPHSDEGIDLKFSALVLLAVPLTMAGEKFVIRDPEFFSVTTSIEIKASADEVWKNVVAFAEIPPPKEWYFRSGIAYPIRARIEGSGPGAVRHCIFSTGEFVEPIDIWDAPHLLRFRVAANPPPMEELTFYSKIHPPHLKNFFVSHQGQFMLIYLSPNRTLLKGTTWYQHHMHPANYWRFWSDWIIHRIHLRVLHHIQRQSEA